MADDQTGQQNNGKRAGFIDNLTLQETITYVPTIIFFCLFLYLNYELKRYIKLDGWLSYLPYIVAVVGTVLIYLFSRQKAKKFGEEYSESEFVYDFNKQYKQTLDLIFGFLILIGLAIGLIWAFIEYKEEVLTYLFGNKRSNDILNFFALRPVKITFLVLFFLYVSWAFLNQVVLMPRVYWGLTARAYMGWYALIVVFILDHFFITDRAIQILTYVSLITFFYVYYTSGRLQSLIEDQGKEISYVEIIDIYPDWGAIAEKFAGQAGLDVEEFLSLFADDINELKFAIDST